MARIKNWHINLIVFIFIIAIVFMIIANIELATDNNARNLEGSAEIEVHFIDVKQAKATLLRGSNFVVLVDAGDYRNDDVVPYLRSLGIVELDLLVGTHPHADHIGQFDKVLNNFVVHEVWMSGDEHTTRTYERAIDAITSSMERHETTYHEPRRGEFYSIGGLSLQVLNPEKLTGDFHEGSIALRAVYKDFSVIITGDLEVEMEREIVSVFGDLTSTILELGHHGSSTSSSYEFIKGINPHFAVYSAGADNSYGHPHREVVKRFEELDIMLLGTDLHGRIIVTSDGKSYDIILEHE